MASEYEDLGLRRQGPARGQGDAGVADWRSSTSSAAPSPARTDTPGPARKASSAGRRRSLGACSTCVAAVRLPDPRQPQTRWTVGARRSSTSSCGSATCGVAAEPPSETSAPQSRWLITGDRRAPTFTSGARPSLSAMQLDERLLSDWPSRRTSTTTWSTMVRAGPGSGGGSWSRPHLPTQARRLQHPVYNERRQRRPRSLLRFVSDEAEQTDRTSVVSYRYLERVHVAMLKNGDPERTRDRLLLGISRLVGAFGYADDGLAMSSGMPAPHGRSCTPCPPTSSRVDRRRTVAIRRDDRRSADARAHVSSPSFTLSLDTAEIILRAADGELVNDLPPTRSGRRSTLS